MTISQPDGLSKIAFVISVCALAMGCKPSDPGDLLVYHTKQVIEIMKNNMNDCETASKKIVAYWRENQAEMRSIRSKLLAMKRTLSRAELAEYGQELKEKYSRLVSETMPVAREFDRKCGRLSAKYRQIMNSLKL
jgi:hypothetical protein